MVIGRPLYPKTDTRYRNMKSRMLFMLIISTILLGGESVAQVELKPAIGINVTDFSDQPSAYNTSAKVGWQLGGTIAVGEGLYGEGGIFWVYKSRDFTENSTNNQFSTELSGFRIPVSIGCHLIGRSGGPVSLRAFGGGSVFILTNQTNPLGLTKDDFNSANYGLFLGAGADIAMLFVDAKYEWSLTDVSSAASFNVGKTKTLFITAGVRIGL